MKKTTFKIIIGFIIFSFVFTGISGIIEYFGSNRKINVKNANISGVWKEFIEIEDDKYNLESISDKPHINLRLKLLKKYTGEEEDPSATLNLIPISKSGNELGFNFLVQSRDRFNEFITGEPGSTAIITFGSSEWIYGSDTSKVSNFELRAFTPKSELTNTKRTVAFPELTGDVSNDILDVATGAVTTALLKNNNIINVIDQNQIEAIQKQHNFQLTNWVDTGNYAEIGRVLNVDTIAIGTVTVTSSFLSKEYYLNLRLIDIETFAIVGSISYSTSTLNTIASDIGTMRIKLKE